MNRFGLLSLAFLLLSWFAPGSFIPSAEAALVVNGYGRPLLLLSDSPETPFVTIQSFTAEWQNPSVLIKWQTATEVDNIGFFMMRSTAPDAGYVQMNPDIIPGCPSCFYGASYSYPDSDVTPGQTYHYKLVAVGMMGVTQDIGPISISVPASCNVARPVLLTPAANARIYTPLVLLDWRDVSCADRYQVQLRQGTATGILVANINRTRSQYMTAALTIGKTYYWRVRACNPQGCSEWSNYRAFSVVGRSQR